MDVGVLFGWKSFVVPDSHWCALRQNQPGGVESTWTTTFYLRMERTEWVRVRLSTEELERLKGYAVANGWTMSQVIRSWVCQLPQVSRPQIPTQAQN